MLAQPPPNRSCLLWSQVERQVLLLGVEKTQLLALIGVDDGENAGDGFAEVVTVMRRGSVTNSYALEKRVMEGVIDVHLCKL